MRVFSSLFILSFLMLGACAPLQIEMASTTPSNKAALTSTVEDTQSENLQVLRTTDIQGTSDFNTHFGPFPTDSNGSVNKWISYYSEGRGRGSTRIFLERLTRYKGLMQEILEEEGLPKELIYLAMVESGFSASANSSASAVGYWQFIKSTGITFGLTINGTIDERRDFVLSTQAAARYLKSLYKIHKDWLLSMAAYNCGSRRLNTGIKRANGNTNFWYLAKKGAYILPEETKNHVPKILALRKIASKPSEFGFSGIEYQAPLDYILVSVKKTFALTSISRKFNIDYQTLKNLNPKYKTDKIYVTGKEEVIRVPPNTQI